MYKKRLRKVREENNLLQKDMSKILNISETSYGNYETEYFIMPLKYLDIVSTNFNIPLDYIFELTESKDKKISNINIDLSAKRLKDFRKENNLTQEKLAKILNVSKTTICEYEHSTNLIATPFLYTICKKYQISADYLLGKIDHPKYLKP